MMLLFLAAWLAARLVISCLENAHAPNQEQTGEKKAGQSSGNRSSVCVCKRPENKEQLEHVCVIQGSRVNCAFKVRCGETTRQTNNVTCNSRRT